MLAYGWFGSKDTLSWDWIDLEDTFTQRSVY